MRKNTLQKKYRKAGLYEAAQKEVLEAILLIENIVQTIGWKLDYSQLKIEDSETRMIDKQ